jgi:hypothetical protein
MRAITLPLCYRLPSTFLLALSETGPAYINVDFALDRRRFSRYHSGINSVSRKEVMQIWVVIVAIAPRPQSADTL